MEIVLGTKNHCVALPNVSRKQRFILIRRFATHLINPESGVIWKPDKQ
jgi:hypothetical protein